MKIAVTGKGGAGKTSFSFLLGKKFRDLGYRVLLVDADPDGNLPDLLGIPAESAVPVTGMKELIRERTGGNPDGAETWFKLNPKVDDIPDRFTIDKDGLELLVMGTIKTGGSGCACSMNSFIRQLLRHLILERDHMVILDMEAGIEHLGRGTTEHVDCMCIVTEPNITGLTTAKRIIKLSEEIGIQNRIIIGNKVADEKDTDYINRILGSEHPVFVPFHRDIMGLSRDPGSMDSIDPSVDDVFTGIAERLQSIHERT